MNREFVPDSEKYIAQFRNVNFVYNKGVAYETVALENVDLDIERNCITGIIGATGSGKSTLVQMLNGLLKPMTGEVYIDGVNIHGKKVKMRDIRFKVGLVMQYPEYQLFDETVADDIAFGPKNMGITGDELALRVMKAADFSGLDKSLLSKSPFDLSGGQKRRAALAGVMAMDPALLVLDEPAAGLDPAGRRNILGRIREYQREKGTSVVIVSHSMEDMARYCDRLIVMEHGRVAMNDKTENVFANHERLRAAGLDVPEITKVAEELKKLGIDIGDDIYTVKYAAGVIAEKFLGKRF
ncbi:MAG: energy-coupling factor transporter ATPase [Ruminococcaceae bacterium]|nr:energy-coupling factor transporter ATPase [Oscillospiraceae bacterium]